MDLVVNLQRDSSPRGTRASAMSSAEARERVLLARERQRSRLTGQGVAVNAQMDARLLREHLGLDATAEELIGRVRERAMLSMRGEHRVLRVARTIADLEGRRRVGARELGSALALRAEAGPASSRAA